MTATAAICPITGQPALLEASGFGDWERYSSPATGGRYEITRSAKDDLAGHIPQSDDRLLLVEWLMRQRLSGTEVPRVTTHQLDRAALPLRPPIADRVDRLLKCLQLASPTLGSSVPYTNTLQTPTDTWSGEETRHYLRAWTASRTDGEFRELVRYAEAEGWVKAGDRIALTVNGWRRLEHLSAIQTASEQAFVAMWFNDEVKAAYEDGIEPAIASVGYVPMRIDRKEHNNKVDDEIIAEIRRSRFVVADFTCGTVVDAGGTIVAVPRGGVYYEAGFAQGLGIPVIWTVREDQINQVHFDTRQFNHVTWKDPQDLRNKLAARIGAVLGDGPRKRA
jgi:hypothetical protein